MASIEVKGIDRDGEPRSMLFESLTPQALTQVLYDTGWKFAILLCDGKKVGGVRLENLRRISWYLVE